MELKSTQDFMLSVSARLTRSGLKMKDLADRSGFAASSLSDAKQGRTSFTFEKANKINKIVDEMVDWKFPNETK